MVNNSHSVPKFWKTHLIDLNIKTIRTYCGVIPPNDANAVIYMPFEIDESI